MLLAMSFTAIYVYVPNVLFGFLPRSHPPALTHNFPPFPPTHWKPFPPSTRFCQLPGGRGARLLLLQVSSPLVFFTKKWIKISKSQTFLYCFDAGRLQWSSWTVARSSTPELLGFAKTMTEVRTSSSSSSSFLSFSSKVHTSSETGGQPSSSRDWTARCPATTLSTSTRSNPQPDFSTIQVTTGDLGVDGDQNRFFDGWSASKLPWHHFKAFSSQFPPIFLISSAVPIFCVIFLIFPVSGYFTGCLRPHAMQSWAALFADFPWTTWRVALRETSRTRSLSPATGSQCLQTRFNFFMILNCFLFLMDQNVQFSNFSSA